MSSRRFLVTAALPYSNGRLHVGHIAGAYLPADIFVRYLRSRGDDVRFICGSDDHGVSALIGAAREGRSVEEYTRDYHDRQAADFKALGIDFDIYAGTHHPDFYELHRQFSQDFFRTLHAKGCFIKKTAPQFYDPQARQFLPDRFVQGKCYHVREDGSPCGSTQATGEQCESCGNLIEATRLIDPISTLTGTTPELRDATHWYLPLGRFAEALSQWLQRKRNPSGAAPWRESTLNFVLARIAAGLPDRAITRDLSWGVPVPLDDPDAAGKVLYIWFENVIGYVSFTAAFCQARDGDWQNYTRWWKDPDCRVVHFIGEDNTIFHTITWPAMILAEGSLQLPHQVVANAFLNVRPAGGEAQKASKSRGTAVWIEDFLRSYDPDSLRYYLTAIAPEGGQATFDQAEFVQRYNSELLNALGNFIHRTLAFTHLYLGARVPPPGERCEADHVQLGLIHTQAQRVTDHLESFEFKAALAEVMALARGGNAYFDAQQPWISRRTDPARCAATIGVCLQTVSALTILMEPFLPFAAARCAGMLNLGGTALRWSAVSAPLPVGQTLREPVVLFKKIENAAVGSLAP